MQSVRLLSLAFLPLQGRVRTLYDALAGFGFGDQDVHWHEKYSPRKIVGMNVASRPVYAA